MSVFEDVFFSGTHGGETLSLAAARAVLDSIARRRGARHRSTTRSRGSAAIGAHWSQRHGFDDACHASVVSPSAPSSASAGPTHSSTRASSSRRSPRRGILFNGSMFICARHTDEDIDRTVAASIVRSTRWRRRTTCARPSSANRFSRSSACHDRRGRRSSSLGAGSIGARHARNLRRSAPTSRCTTPTAVERGACASDIGARSSVDPAPGLRSTASSSPARRRCTPNSWRWALRVAGEGPGREAARLAPARRSIDTSSRRPGADDGRLQPALRSRLRCGAHVGPVTADVATSLGGRIWFGSYLPDWRPSVDYRDTYSARRSLGGGVLRDAIHELDLLVWILGWPIDVVGGWIGRGRRPEIDVEDTVRAVLVTRPRAHRCRSTRLPESSLSARHRARLRRRHHPLRLGRASHRGRGSDGDAQRPCPPSVDQTYIDEAREFLDYVDGTPTTTGATGDEGLLSVALAEQIEAACGP